MNDRLIFGSPEANRIAAEIKFLEKVEDCPRCGKHAELDKYAGPLPAGVYYRFRCPDHHLFGKWKDDKTDAMLSWSGEIKLWWELNGERLNLDPPDEEAAR